MLSKQLETVKLTARFKIDGKIDESLFKMYKVIVNELLDYAYSKNITSFKKLKAKKKTHYIYTACQMTCSIYKSFRKRKRKGKFKSSKPQFRKDVVMLDMEKWTVRLPTPNGRIKLKLLHGKYYEKFKRWKVVRHS